MQTVRPLTHADLPRAVEVLRHAFVHDPALAFLLPDPTDRELVEPQLAAAFCRYCIDHGIAWCTDDVSGVALRRPPGAEHLSWWGLLTSGMVFLPFHLGWSATQRLLTVDHETSKRHTRAVQGDHWYLWTLAVDPERQGEGLGGALMQKTFREADAAGLPCYLETTHPRALAIHRAHGFEVVDDAPIPGTDLTVWSMVRPPRAKDARAA